MPHLATLMEMGGTLTAESCHLTTFTGPTPLRERGVPPPALLWPSEETSLRMLGLLLFECHRTHIYDTYEFIEFKG